MTALVIPNAIGVVTNTSKVCQSPAYVAFAEKHPVHVRLLYLP